VVADLKTADGAVDEVNLARQAGATAATVLGHSPLETLDLFIMRCNQLNMISMIDMLGIDDPLKVMRPLKIQPDVVVIHRGRDEESNSAKTIRYRHINRVRSKYNYRWLAGWISRKPAAQSLTVPISSLQTWCSPEINGVAS